MEQITSNLKRKSKETMLSEVAYIYFLSNQEYIHALLVKGDIYIYIYIYVETWAITEMNDCGRRRRRRKLREGGEKVT